jgi:hypothetical protein
MDLIERIGPYLGLAAFLGFAVLVLLVIQQARDVRRLRAWAGQAPERAINAAESRGDEVPEPDRGPVSRRLVGWGASMHDRIARAWARVGDGFRALDRRSPIDLRVILGLLCVAAIAAAVFFTGGLGLLDDDGRGGGDRKRAAPPPGKVEVAVLNGTASTTGGAVPGLATEVSKLVRAAGYKLGTVTDTGGSFVETVVMYRPGSKAAARQLAGDLDGQLGRTPTDTMPAAIQQQVGGADVALVLGQDDAELTVGGPAG